MFLFYFCLLNYYPSKASLNKWAVDYCNRWSRMCISVSLSLTPLCCANMVEWVKVLKVHKSCRTPVVQNGYNAITCSQCMVAHTTVINLVTNLRQIFICHMVIIAGHFCNSPSCECRIHIYNTIVSAFTAHIEVNKKEANWWIQLRRHLRPDRFPSLCIVLVSAGCGCYIMTASSCVYHVPNNCTLMPFHCTLVKHTVKYWLRVSFLTKNNRSIWTWLSKCTH